MSNYTIAVDWAGKNALSDSDAAKIISGTDFNTEFTTVQTAVNSKADLNGSSSEDFAINNGTVAGDLTAPTQSQSDNSTKVATTAYVDTAVAALDKAAINDLVYPVGSIFCTVATGDPATVLGIGTWVAFGSGQVMVGQQSSAHDSTGTGSDSDFNTREETGGAKTHTLTVAEMPSHSHSMHGVSSTFDPNHGMKTAQYKASSATLETNDAGSGDAHNNLQPYIVVRMWKRTA